MLLDKKKKRRRGLCGFREWGRTSQRGQRVTDEWERQGPVSAKSYCLSSSMKRGPNGITPSVSGCLNANKCWHSYIGKLFLRNGLSASCPSPLLHNWTPRVYSKLSSVLFTSSLIAWSPEHTLLHLLDSDANKHHKPILDPEGVLGEGDVE